MEIGRYIMIMVPSKKLLGETQRYGKPQNEQMILFPICRKHNANAEMKTAGVTSTEANSKRISNQSFSD